MNLIKKAVNDLIGSYKTGLNFLKAIDQDCNDSGNFQSIENNLQTIQSNEKLISLYGSILKESFTMASNMRSTSNVPSIESGSLDENRSSLEGGSSSAVDFVAVDHDHETNETKFDVTRTLDLCTVQLVDLTKEVRFKEKVTVINSATKIHRRRETKLMKLDRKNRGSHLTARCARQVRDGDIQFTKVRSTKSTNGICFFCEKNKSLNKSQWQRHLIFHTKEDIFFCDECGLNFSKRKGHPCPVKSIQNIYKRNGCLGDGFLAAFLCKLCNYVQVNESKLNDHLRNEHADMYGAAGDALSLYEKCKFVTNL